MKCPTSTGVHARPTMYQEGVPRGAINFFYMSRALLLLCPPTPEHVPPPLSGTRQWIRQDPDVDTARPGCGGGETRQYKDSGTRQWMASLGLRWGGCFISTLLDGILQARIGLQDFLRGGGREDVHKHTHPLNIVRVTSSALQKIEKHPHSWTFTSTPCLGGGGDRSRSRTHTLLYRLFYQYHTITKNLKYALVMKHQIYRLKVDGANLGIVGIVRPLAFCQPVWHKRSFAAAIHPALG